MKLGFAPSIGPFDGEVIVDCDVEWELGSPRLCINDVLDSGGKFSLLFDYEDEPLLTAIGFRIADMAEDDDRLLARAVAQDNDEREAA
jgi:hypothetical protein